MLDGKRFLLSPRAWKFKIAAFEECVRCTIVERPPRLNSPFAMHALVIAENVGDGGTRTRMLRGLAARARAIDVSANSRACAASLVGSLAGDRASERLFTHGRPQRTLSRPRCGGRSLETAASSVDLKFQRAPILASRIYARLQ